MTIMAAAFPFWATDDASPLSGDPTGGSGRSFSDTDLARPILVVEDEVLIAWMMESLLEDAGFTSIRLATSAADALSIATERAPELLISDINLGAGDDGIDAAIRIRRIAAAPVIFVSAYIDENARRRIAEDIGDAIVLRKPVERGALLDALRTMLNTPRAH